MNSPMVERLHPADVPRRSDSSFRDLLEALDLRGVNRILDVGAGGFIGQTTTVHLVELFEAAHLTAVEIDPDRARALEEHFGDRIEVVASDVERFQADSPFDLIVIDLDTTRLPLVFERLLPSTIPRLAAPDAVVITDFLCDYFVAFGRSEPLPAANAPLIRDHLVRQFGRLQLTDATVKRTWSDPQYDPLVAIEKWRGDPGNFIGWLALRFSPTATVPAEETVEAIPAEPMPTERELRIVVLAAQIADGSAVAVDMNGAWEGCGSDCPTFIAKWSDWCRTFTGGWYPLGEVVPSEKGSDAVVPQAPAALLEIPTDFGEYMKGVGPKSRNMLRKCEREGYEFREFEYNDFLDDMYAINTSKPERSGGPMTASYLERLQPVGAPELTCERHRQVYIGGFKGERLYAYCALAIVNELAVVNKILGHADALPDGVMNGLIAELVRFCEREGMVRAIDYLTLESSADGLAHFKRSVGFRSSALIARLAPVS